MNGRLAPDSKSAPSKCREYQQVDMTDVAAENHKLYGSLYRKRHPLAHLVRAFVSYDQKSKSRLNWAVVGPVIAQLVASGQEVRILDFGCGWGTFLLDAPRRQIRLFGYDIETSAVDNLSSTMQFVRRHFEPAHADASGNMTPCGFDAIVCSHVLEHVPDADAQLRAFSRALRPGGFLLVNVPINELVKDPRHARAYDRYTLEQALERAKFRVRKVLECDRLSGLVIRIEDRMGSWMHTLLRGPRGILAIAPMCVTQALERLIASKMPHQQLIVLAEKCD